MSEPLPNGVDIDLDIKEEFVDDPECVVPSELGINDADIDLGGVEDLVHFTETEVQCVEKCLENVKLVIKDFETQLDWHLKQYMNLRSYFKPNGNMTAQSKNDQISVSNLNAMIDSNPETDKERKQSGNRGSSRRKRKNYSDEEEEMTTDDDSDEESYNEEDDDDMDSSDYTVTKGKKRSANVSVKSESEDEIEEEHHELVVPKSEMEDDSEDDELPPPKKTTKRGGKRKQLDSDSDDDFEAKPAKKTPAKGKGKTPKKAPAKKAPAKKVPAKKGGKSDASTACSVMIERLDDDYEDKKPGKEELGDLIKPKLIKNLEDLIANPKKPMVMLDETNVDDFDFETDTTDNSFVITYDDPDELPDFIYDNKEIIANILSGNIKLVLNSIYEEHYANKDK